MGSEGSLLGFLALSVVMWMGVLATTIGESKDTLEKPGVLMESSPSPSLRISLKGEELADKFHDWLDSSEAAPSFCLWRRNDRD